MKISHVTANNRRRCFLVKFGRRELPFPYARCDPSPSRDNPIVKLFIDDELAREGFTYVLKAGEDGCVLLDHVLDHNCDPVYLRDLLLHRLTVEALARVKKSPLSRRELIRHLDTSPAQFYRLIDPTNYRKTIDQMMKLLVTLGCEVDFVVTERPGTAARAPKLARSKPSQSKVLPVTQGARARSRGPRCATRD